MAELDSGAGAAGGGEGGGEGGGAFEALTGGSGGDAGAGGGAGGDDAAAAAAAAAAGNGDAGAGGADPDWYANLSVDPADGEAASNRDWIKAKGFKDLDGLTKALRSAEKSIHDKGLVKIPGEGASADEVAAYRTAIGVPDSAAGYALDPIKDGEGNDVPLDTALLDRLAARALELGMPKAQYQGLVQDFVAAQIEQLGSLDGTMQADAAAWMKAQGDKVDVRRSEVNRGADFLGLTGEDLVRVRNELGSARTLDMLAKLGAATGEDMLLGGVGNGRFLANGAEAQVQIDAMRADPKVITQMTKKGTPENAKYERLSRIVEEAANRQAAAG